MSKPNKAASSVLPPRKMELSLVLSDKDDSTASLPFRYGMDYDLEISWRMPEGGWTVAESSRGFATQGEVGEDCLPVILRFLHEDYLHQVSLEKAAPSDGPATPDG